MKNCRFSGAVRVGGSNCHGAIQHPDLSNMFGNRSNVKYTAIEKTEDTANIRETVDFEPMKRKFCTPSCLGSALFTGALIGTYYIPSVGLTFYQRWLSQVVYRVFRWKSAKFVGFQRFPYPLLTVLVHMIVKFLLAALVRLFLSRKHVKVQTTISWKDYVLAVAPTGVFSGIDIGFSNWGLELITVSL